MPLEADRHRTDATQGHGRPAYFVEIAMALAQSLNYWEGVAKSREVQAQAAVKRVKPPYEFLLAVAVLAILAFALSHCAG